VFGISSAIAAGFDSAGPVIAARGVMGLGAAIMMPVAFAVLAAVAMGVAALGYFVVNL